MDRYPRNGSLVQNATSDLQTFMAQVYGWMTCGLLLTAFVSWYAANNERIMFFIFSNRMTFFCLIIAQLAVVFVLSGLVHRLSSTLATSLFMLHSGLTGLTMASVFLTYTYSSIASTFLVTAGMFGVMSVYGYTTKRDISRFSNLLFMALVGILLASMVNFWMKSTMLMWMITYISVIVFVGLTAYDTQQLRQMGDQIDMVDHASLRRYSIMGALKLYLDFINLFLALLRILGNRR
ncbi:Bax inhibitor-1/YccA family protein [Pantoea sp. Nvir]|uniref:Bax inhibitor-1/YccA family protein n=1 Tax=Pantoea sp. Nvir TaxID=2576760 RepID=UPI00135AB3B7|nr:Bax inhibitor-1/YccA family protein [Pantoea sp. Nvir]MXP66309.1 Bax inhibitor-1/YccA family protein [Pantoea sp. Nvir]CAJ0992905.1 Inner membrane protein YbhL [Pantoea sp. Nvir]